MNWETIALIMKSSWIFTSYEFDHESLHVYAQELDPVQFKQDFSKSTSLKQFSGKMMLFLA